MQVSTNTYYRITTKQKNIIIISKITENRHCTGISIGRISTNIKATTRNIKQKKTNFPGRKLDPKCNKKQIIKNKSLIVVYQTEQVFRYKMHVQTENDHLHRGSKIPPELIKINIFVRHA